MIYLSLTSVSIPKALVNSSDLGFIISWEIKPSLRMSARSVFEASSIS